MEMLRGADGSLYEVTHCYSSADGAWSIELTAINPTPSRRDLFLTALVSDEDPTSTPVVHLGPSAAGCEVPYDVLVQFMALVAAEVAEAQAGFARSGD
ncbi:hypothetical protein JOF53_007681 [Crossiella equi]|uniref:Uncharacterized protein n=1 Tax=Crossiella equi TaxID=130796 RepID=A0ABS5ARG0_9PSEU|nr:hypothetical protein [Crossiella equi]MBP2478809.1 hypothetical protein [Crossiella equi]